MPTEAEQSLPPRAALALAEIAAALATREVALIADAPSIAAGRYWTDQIASNLVHNGMIRFTVERGDRYVALTPKGFTTLSDLGWTATAFEDPGRANEILYHARRIAIGDRDTAVLTSTGRMATDWLNLDPPDLPALPPQPVVAETPLPRPREFIFGLSLIDIAVVRQLFAFWRERDGGQAGDTSALDALADDAGVEAQDVTDLKARIEAGVV